MKLTRLAEDQLHPWLEADPPSWEWPRSVPVPMDGRDVRIIRRSHEVFRGALHAAGIRIRVRRG